MKVRILTALGMAVVGIPLLIFSEYIVFPIALAIVSAIGAWELLRVVGFHKRFAVSVPSIALAALLPLFTFGDFLPVSEHKNYLLVVALCVFAYLMYLIVLSVIYRGSLGYKNIAAAFMGVVYVTVSFTSLGLIRYMDNGFYYFLLVFIGPWSCDIFAYFTGRLLGRHKLCPELSPKKTVEGSVGGIVFTLLAFLVYGLILSLAASVEVNYPVLLLLALAVSVISQIGDLFASLIKREYGVKDYSRMLPGHGGVLDRFDSVLAVCSVIMVVCLLFPPFA